MAHIDTSGDFTVKGYGASGSLIGGKTLEPIDIPRNKPQADELLIEVLYCGVCHSDLHQVNNDWKNTIYPCVPGHEVVGRVTETGSSVNRFSVGDIVGVGCMIDSCRSCKSCEQGEEQLCTGPVRMTMTYNGFFKPNPDAPEFNTYGGYSTHLTAKEDFVLRIPEQLNLSEAAPILCAGVTTYSPLKHWGVKPGDKVGIIGIGGLGHMGVMLAKAMGAEVVAITTQEHKRIAALELGADAVLISEDADAMKAHEVTFDFLLCTIPYAFDVNPYISLLGPRGSLVTVGLLGPYKSPTNNMEVAGYSRSVGASVIGGIAETQEVLDFCAKHNILPQVEMIRMQDINEALDKIKDEEVRFRYVIDMGSLKE
ncbi:MAG: hydroxyacid dehydrogenase [Flavobacterium sp. BFFFF1]|uniref:NAD(P)-dependent alcohol dehydrogenase n=1 Tax=Flavobacterium sp. BFFFF1 TaxID=2015557 RepID=UPI000BC8C944|nr:NAD(P)-dependent alcohol dehydrogenase [Flavobacterium sp. BFFFF1]OYU79274.1 MAG: hydroxyacid dehydrogenase [Flavobacterium sp. BFFFF1]